MFDYVQNPTNPNGWYTQDQGSGAEWIDQGGGQNITLATATPEFLKAIGFNGPVLVTTGEGDNRETIINPDIGAYMRDNGITLQRRYTGQADDAFQDQAMRNGQPIEGGSLYYDNTRDDAFEVAAILAGGVMGGAAAGLGSAGAAGGGAAAGGAGATAAGGLSSAELAALYGAEGYGAGMGGAGLTSAGVGGAGLSSADLAALYGSEGYGAGMTAAEVAAAGGGGTGVSSGGWMDSITNYLGSDSGLKTLGNIGSTLINSYQSGKALDAQTDATREANALQKYMYDQTRADWAPYRGLGYQGLAGYSNLLKNPGSITSDPGYQFGLNQGQTAIDRSAASKGSLYSGATLKALDRYGQDYAGTKYDNALNRYGNAAQIGATGVSSTQNAGTNYANQAGANTTGLGNAAAGQAMYNGSLWGNALAQGVSAYTNQNKPWWQQG